MRVRIVRLPQAQDGMDVPMNNPFDMGEMPEETPIEVEQGEIMEMEPDEENPEGSIVKVSDEAPTHEEGGVVVTGASRILEDTSDKRDDALSKFLKLKPEEVEELTGYKPKKSLTHSRAYEEAQEYWDSQLSKMEKKLEKNFEYAKNTNSVYAKNSLDENAKQLARVPSPQQLFDNLFEYQESLKEQAGYEQEDEAGYGFRQPRFAKGGQNFFGDDQVDIPLNYTDIAGPALNYLESLGRMQVPYNPIQLQTSELQYMSPTPMLSQINEGFSTLARELPANAVGYANLANLFAKKTAATQQALGQVANINKEIFNKQQMYRDQMANQQAQLDASMRLNFDQRYKTSLEKQRQQRAVSRSDVFDTFNKYRQFKNNASLANKLGEFYNIMGERTSENYIFNDPEFTALLKTTTDSYLKEKEKQKKKNKLTNHNYSLPKFW